MNKSQIELQMPGAVSSAPVAENRMLPAGMGSLNVLIGCEESQAVCIEMRKLGHNAFSCDLQECSGGHPEWHIKFDVMKVINGGCFCTQSGQIIQIDKWDMGIFFPDCTYLTVSANKWYKDQPRRKSGVLVGPERREARIKAIKFATDLYECGIEKVSIENPIGVLSTYFRKPDQVLQPWMFGHGETKGTCLWLKGLPKLEPTNVVTGRVQRLHLLPKTPDRAKIRSKTYHGIAAAMAMQWAGNACR